MPKVPYNWPDPVLNRECAECGLTFGGHRGSDGLCPGHQGQMDWDASPGTYFRDAGSLIIVPYGDPALNSGGLA